MKKGKIKNHILRLILKKPVNARRKLSQYPRVNGKELREAEETTYCTTWNFSFVTTFLVPERKEKRLVRAGMFTDTNNSTNISAMSHVNF